MSGHGVPLDAWVERVERSLVRHLERAADGPDASGAGTVRLVAGGFTSGATRVELELVAGPVLHRARAALGAGTLPLEMPVLATTHLTGDPGVALDAWHALDDEVKGVRALALLLDVPSWVEAAEEAERRVGALVALGGAGFDPVKALRGAREVLRAPEPWDEIFERGW